MSDAERPAGYVRLARKLFDGNDAFWPTPFSDRFSRGEAWVDLIQMAAWRDGAMVAGVRLGRGEVCGSLRWFARRWCWGVNAVRGFFEQLESKSRIRARTKARTWAQTPSVYLLVNYGLFNTDGASAGTYADTDAGTDGTRTPHKDEEVKKVKTPPSSSDASRPSLSTLDHYPEAFERTWAVYPRRAGGNPKRRAFQAWSARLKSGASAEEIHAGVESYARFCQATRKTGTEFVKQAATFFGPDEHFRELWDVPAGAGDDGRDLPASIHPANDPRPLGPDEVLA